MPDSLLTSSGAAAEHHEAYEIAERIAVGPAGIVYRALQSETQREVLFKVLNPSSTHPLDSARLSVIKSSVNAVRQRWIAEWIDAYDDPDGFVLVHDFKKGIAGNLFPTEERHLSKADGLLLANQFCEVLQAAEQAALPHGDIKPSNIILWNDPEQGLTLHVLDWGLSICRSQHPEESLSCMSPERLRGGAPTLTGDFFSVGVTLSFLLTGYYPVQGSSAEEIITGWRNFNTASITQLRPDLDINFCQWLAGLMSFESKDRPASAAQALDALNKAIAADTQPFTAPDTAIAAQKSLTRSSAKPHPAPHRAQIVTPTRLISASSTAQIKESELTPTTKPKQSGKTRVMKGVLTVCIIAGFAVASSIWAQKKYGLEWNDLLAGRWHEGKTPAVKTDPVIANAKPATVTTPPPNKAVPATKVAVVAPPKPVVTFQFRDPLVYPKDAKLDGSKGGTGWPGPWRASNNLVSISPSRKSLVMTFGGADVSNARREIAAFTAVEASGICLVCSIMHSGAQGPVLSLDVLSPANGSGPAPVLLIPKGDKLIVSIPKITQTVEIASKGILRIATLWTFKKQADGKYEITLTVYLNPALGRRASLVATPALSYVTKDFIPPDVIELALASIGTSKLGANISDIRIAPTLLEALK